MNKQTEITCALVWQIPCIARTRVITYSALWAGCDSGWSRHHTICATHWHVQEVHPFRLQVSVLHLNCITIFLKPRLSDCPRWSVF